MVGDGKVMRITTLVGLQSNVAPNLPSGLIAVPPQQSDEIVTGKITRQPQLEITSSFTTCKRITGGAFPASK
jgi:hypothetical protein